ncbi:hypothetical protein FOA52_002221 [Chlamydomonas sp. UWO 241]|nr:hypothetical protein FOA52_002221 [Chlamydomonas sp. UWO 241]
MGTSTGVSADVNAAKKLMELRGHDQGCCCWHSRLQKVEAAPLASKVAGASGDFGGMVEGQGDGG